MSRLEGQAANAGLPQEPALIPLRTRLPAFLPSCLPGLQPIGTLHALSTSTKPTQHSITRTHHQVPDSPVAMQRTKYIHSRYAKVESENSRPWRRRWRVQSIALAPSTEH